MSNNNFQYGYACINTVLRKKKYFHQEHVD